MKSVNPSGSRIDLNTADSIRDIRKLVPDSRVKVLQFSSRLPLKFLEALNEEFFAERPDVELRVFGFYGDNCDLSFCSRMSNVGRFRADCLSQASSAESIAEMPKLTLLGIGIFDLEGFDFLSGVSANLTELTLGQTRSRKPDLLTLSRFSSLRTLGLFGQQKGIEVLENHPALEDVRMSLSLDSVRVFGSMPRLSSLDVGLGGTRDFSALVGKTSLKHLALWRIPRLEEVDFVSTLTGLQRFHLENQPRLRSLPSLSRLSALRRIELIELKGLTDVSALIDAPVLEDLRHTSAQTSPDDYRNVLRKPSMKAASVFFGKAAKNARFAQLAREAGVSDTVSYDFDFH